MSLMVVAFTSNEAEYAEMFADILAILREVHSSLLVVVLYETSLERIPLGWLSIIEDIRPNHYKLRVGLTMMLSRVGTRMSFVAQL